MCVCVSVCVCVCVCTDMHLSELAKILTVG